MHPYRMQRLIKERGKDQVINVAQRASLYQMIGQLLKAELITFWGTDRQEGFPERTVYQLTDKGRQTATAWLREMLAEPEQDFPDFPAAVSLLPLLTPEDALHQMQAREENLLRQITELKKAHAPVARLFLLETEYKLTILETELAWVRSLISDLQTGQLAWTQEWMRPFEPPVPDS